MGLAYIVASVASFDVAEAGEGRRVRLMVGRGTSEFRPTDDFPGQQIVHVGATLGHVQQADPGQEQVVVHEKRPVVHLDEQIFGGVVVEKVSRDVRDILRRPGGRELVLQAIADAQAAKNQEQTSGGGKPAYRNRLLPTS